MSSPYWLVRRSSIKWDKWSWLNSNFCMSASLADPMPQQVASTRTAWWFQHVSTPSKIVETTRLWLPWQGPEMSKAPWVGIGYPVDFRNIPGPLSLARRPIQSSSLGQKELICLVVEPLPILQVKPCKSFSRRARKSVACSEWHPTCLCNEKQIVQLCSESYLDSRSVFSLTQWR